MNIDGRLALAGITDQQDGNFHDWSLSWFTPALVAVSLTGQIVPISGSLQHSADLKTIKDNRGNEVTLIATNEKMMIEMVAVPLGVSGHNSLADVLTAAQFPAPGGWLTIANAPALVMGNFSPAFNSVDWTYNADGRIELVSDGEWGMRFSCTRRRYLSRAAAVSI